MFKHWPWFLFFIAVAFASAGVRPLGEPDEGRYAETARGMLVTGNWLVPHLQGQPHLTKPPLTYWSIAAGMRVFGVNEWGARLPLSLAFFLTILCVVELARTWGMSAGACVAAGLVFCTALLPFVCGHLLTTDMFLTCWETLGILALWKVWRGARPAFAWRWVFWLAFALAFLTKGPPGWLPLLAVAVFRPSSRMHRPKARIFSIPAVLCFLLLSFSWYLAVIYRDPELLGYFLGNEVVGRVFSGVHERGKPIWFYPAVIAAGLFPWVFLWPALLRRTLVDIKPELADRGAFPSFTRLRATVSRYWQLTHEQRELNFFVFLWGMIVHSAAFAAFKIYHFWHRLRRTEDIKFFSFLWFFVPLAVFCISSSKMFFYIVPLFAPLAIWCGHVLATTFHFLYTPRITHEASPNIPHSTFPLPHFPSPLFRRWFPWGAALWCVAALVFLNFPDLPQTIDSHRTLSREVRKFSARTGAKLLYAIENPRHSISFYTGLPIRELDEDDEDVLKYLRRNHGPAQGPALLTIKKSKVRKLGDKEFTVVADDGAMVVLQVGSEKKGSSE